MKKPSVVLDTVLSFAATFLLCAVITGYFTRDTLTVTVTALTVTLSVTFFLTRLLRKKRAPARQRRKLQELCNKFLFSPPEYAYAFAKKALGTRCTPVEHNGLLLSNTAAFCVCLTPAKITVAFLAEKYGAAAGTNKKRLVFLSAFGAENDALETAKQLQSPAVEIWPFEKVYDFFARLGCAPTETLALHPEKRKIGTAFRGALRRENARKYLLTSVVLLLFARFMPYSVLYAVLAAVSSVLAFVSFALDTSRKGKRSG